MAPVHRRVAQHYIVDARALHHPTGELGQRSRQSRGVIDPTRSGRKRHRQRRPPTGRQCRDRTVTAARCRRI